MDNIVAHWIFGLHRAVPGPWATPVEIGLVLLGVGMLAWGCGASAGHGATEQYGL